jgi:hypothetical protein
MGGGRGRILDMSLTSFADCSTKKPSPAPAPSRLPATTTNIEPALIQQAVESLGACHLNFSHLDMSHPPFAGPPAAALPLATGFFSRQQNTRSMGPVTAPHDDGAPTPSAKTKSRNAVKGLSAFNPVVRLKFCRTATIFSMKMKQSQRKSNFCDC